MISAVARNSIAVALGVFLGACFSESKSGSPACPPGSEGCPCLDLQCEGGLVCDNAMCVAGDTGTSASDTTSNGTSTTTSTTTSADGSSSGAASTSSSTDASTGTADTCGNGMLDAQEECDGTPGCTDLCELQSDAWDCNPLNNYPCPDGFKCSVIEPRPFDVQTVCLPVPAGPPIEDTNDPPPGGIHDSNCVYENSFPHDEWCDIGLACAYSNLTTACEVNCCVEFCDLTKPFTCAWVDDTCQPFFNPGVPTGFEHLGYCITP